VLIGAGEASVDVGKDGRGRSLSGQKDRGEGELVTRPRIKGFGDVDVEIFAKRG
jgi:hypothetical protein